MNYISSPNYKAKPNLKDLGDLSLVQGDILYYDGSNLAKLGAGSSGQFLKTQGTGANPIWDAPTGSGDVVGPSSATDSNVVFFDSTTGKLIKDSGLTLSGTNTGDQTISDATISITDITTNNATTSAHGFLPKLDGGTTEFLRADGTWVVPSGSGDVVGPSSATDNAIVRYDGTTGKLIQDSGVTIDDNGTINIPSGQTYQIDGSDLDASDIGITDSGSYYTGTEVETALQELGEFKQWQQGFDLQTPDSNGELSWDDSTRVFTIAVKSGESNYYFWANGKKITKTSSASVTIPDTTGTYYIYFDNSGTLQYVALSSVTDPLFYQYALVGLVYWNATSGKGRVGNERHGTRMSSTTHQYNHDTFGARYENGISIEGLSDGGTTYSQTTSGHFWDEDIRHPVSAESTHPFLYRLGADGEWTATAVDNNVCFKNSGTYGVWNEWTGSTWQLTQGDSSHDFVIYFYIALPSISGNQVMKIIGQNGYSTRANARNAIETERANLITDGLPNQEFIFLYATIVKRDGTLKTLADGSLYLDLRTEKGGVGGSSTSTLYAQDIPTDITNFDNNLSSTDIDVQTALETLDDINHNDLGGLQGGTADEYYHLTSAEHTVVGNTSGANTGDQDLSGKADVDQTMYIGTTGVAINRGTGALTLAGITLTTPDVGTPSAGTLTNCTFPTLNQNTTGTAANLSGTPALPDGTTATTQSASDNSTKLATTAYADAVGGGSGITWSAVTTDATMAVDTGSLANKGTLLTLTLPATSVVGKTVRVAGMNAGLWKIAQAANQYIKFGNQNTTTGTGGSLASVATYDAVELVCIETNVGWVVVSSIGNITVA